MEKIDYEKLNERIVEQAYETAFGELTQEPVSYTHLRAHETLS
jgi:hypothetical protein